MISFKGAQFPKEVILFAVFFYVRYTVSYRDLEEIMAERGVILDHATLNRWVAKYSPLIANTARRRKAPTDRSWRMDETHIKVKGEWAYLYRAVDKLGKTLEFAARTFGSCCRSGATRRLRPSSSRAPSR
jgi:putative transposase